MLVPLLCQAEQQRRLALLGGVLGLSLAGLALYNAAEQPAGQEAARPAAGAVKAGGAAAGARKQQQKKLPEYSKDEVRPYSFHGPDHQVYTARGK